MRKALIIIGAVVVVLAIVIVIGVVNLEGLINKNKGPILARAEKAIGREITLGEIGISLRGGLGVQLSDVTLSDDPLFSSDPLVTAKHLQVNVKLLPLLRKEVQVKRVILREPVFNIIKDADGLLNVMTLAGGSGKAGESKEAAAAPLVVSLVNIEDGEIHFTDRAKDMTLHVTDIDSKVTDFELDKPISLELDAALLADKQNFKLVGRFGPVGEDPDATPVDATIVINPIDIGRLTDALPEAKAALPPDVNTAGAIGIEVQASGTSGNLALSVRIDGTSLVVEVPATFKKNEGVPLSLTSDVLVAGEQVTLSNVDITLHSLRAKGGGEYRLGDAPTIALDLASEPTSLNGWNTIVPALAEYSLDGSMTLNARIEGPVGPGLKPNVSGQLKLTDVSAAVPQAPKPISQLNSTVSFTDKTATVTGTSLRIGDSRIEADATVSSFEPLTVRYKASSPALNLDDVRPPLDPAASPPAKRPVKPEVVRDLLVEGNLSVVGEKPTGNGTVRSAGGSVADIEYKNLSGRFAIDGDRMDLADIKAGLLGGSIDASGVVMTGELPSFEIKTQARSLNVVGALQTIPNVAKSHLRGTSNFDITLSGSGKEWTQIQPTVSGGGSAELLDGAIVDVNIMQAIINEITQTSGLNNLISQRVQNKYPKAFKDRDTQFKNLRSSFAVEDGKLLIRNLKLDADEYAFAGVGALDFNRGLSMNVTLTVSQALSKDIATDFSAASYLANEKGQIQIPFVLEGTLPNVKARADADFMNAVVQKALVGEGLNLLGDDKLKQGVQDLFNRGKKKKN